MYRHVLLPGQESIKDPVTSTKYIQDDLEMSETPVGFIEYLLQNTGP